ncbi:hypothetical protein E8E12_005872 [Didymella heteroderae]|uniref:DUF6536 domain-containing protein n=1 Tax=Didymella heteroderae TaxID=1769908 RepID=A0A9P5BZ99_9PLEO|nr:hypothetical protein E8E12_005872 [Didymella heteroderae]
MNVIFLLVGETSAGLSNFSSNQGKRTLYDGNCGTTKRINIGVHLLINVLIFASITASEYMIFSVTEEFVDRSVNNFTRIDITRNDEINVINHMFNLAQAGGLQRLNKSDCVNAYAQTYQSARGNLLLVVSNAMESYGQGAVADFEDQITPITSLDDSSPDPFNWICHQDITDTSCENSISKVQGHIADWQPYGDAISSFLTLPDPRTKGMCLLDKRLKHFEPGVSYPQRTESGEYSSMGWTAPPKYFHFQRKRHFTAASSRRWVAFLITFVVLVGTSIFLLLYGVYWYKSNDKASIYTQGLGTVDPRGFISWSLPTSGAVGLVSNVVVANTPQLLLSFLYLNYNGLMTVMSLAQEWSRYGIRRNGLRVSTTRKGAQRTTYFLQLPYRFSIPIIIVTGTLHWLISQSVFLVSVEAIMLIPSPDAVLGDSDIWDTVNPTYLMTCGYSPPAILASIIVASLLLIWIVGMGFIKLPSSMPVAASCSAAIAAACHAPMDEIDESTAEKMVMWGDMGEDEKGIGHCGFSKQEVAQPENGKLYA